MGVNGIRLAHNPYAESFYELADQHGMLLVDELFDKWEGRVTTIASTSSIRLSRGPARNG